MLFGKTPFQLVAVLMSIALTASAENQQKAQNQPGLLIPLPEKQIPTLRPVLGAKDKEFPDQRLIPRRKIIKSQLAAGTGSSGGGDALQISAKAFQNQQLLSEAVVIATTTVEEADIDQELKRKFVTELSELFTQGKIKEISAIILTDGYSHSTHRSFGYKRPEQKGQFIDLACFTNIAIGGEIYCSKERVTNYSPDELAATLLHEVLHHILPPVLSTDEEFVEDLGNAFIENKFSKAIQFAIQHNIYIRKGQIRRDQLLKNFDFTIDDRKHDKKYPLQSYCTNKNWSNSHLIEHLYFRMQENVFDREINWIPFHISSFLESKGMLRPQAGRLAIEVTMKKLKQLGVDTLRPEFESEWHILTFGCKKIDKGHFLKVSKCKPEDEVKLEELLLPLVQEN